MAGGKMALFTALSEGRVLCAFRGTLKTEYTVLRVRKPYSSGTGCAAKTASFRR